MSVPPSSRSNSLRPNSPGSSSPQPYSAGHADAAGVASERWLLLDYGEVLSLAQPASVKNELAVLSNTPEAELFPRYWEHRPAYDRGEISASAYWQSVLGLPAAPPAQLLGKLVATDAKSWLQPNRATLAAAARAALRGWQLAILSNAPFEIAAAIDRLDWLSAFSPRLFSCHIGEIKPHPDAFASALKALGAPPSAVWFFDDRESNVAAASRAGICATTFEDAAQIDAI